MRRIRLVAIGACAVDTILTVPHFPKEDSKLRALSLTKRRGGNCPNTLEVLNQLLVFERDQCEARRADGSLDQESRTQSVPELTLIATLPARSSPQIPMILSSFDHSNDNSSTFAGSANIDFSHCLYRESHTEPVSSYIISDQSTGSRTIVNHNDLREMTFEEFKTIADDLLTYAEPAYSDAQDVIWFHFEGRILPTTLACIKYLRRHAAFAKSALTPVSLRLRISVELEKPQREGLQELAQEADVIFYSKSWAEGEGYESAEDCLTKQASVLGLEQKRILICTWGEKGACALQTPCGHDELHNSVVSRGAFPSKDPVVDTVGAGDTFIAGMLFGFLCRDEETSAAERGYQWSLSKKLDFANELAGRKVTQQGFEGLGKCMTSLWMK